MVPPFAALAQISPRAVRLSPFIRRYVILLIDYEWLILLLFLIFRTILGVCQVELFL